MATTSAFGWETPDDTDLVKDGAAAIRTLGNSIDTSLAELKGGTTGQILSKTSATDMDFTWITNDQGDITGVTAGTGLTGGGTTGAVTLNVDPTYSGFTGLNYAKNRVINGAFDIWQRGTSFSLSASSGVTYTADRWAISTNANQACTVSRQATGDTTNLPFIQYAMRVQRNSGQTGTGLLLTTQSLESVNAIPFAGKTVTVSFYARAGANYSSASSALTAYFMTGTGTDQNRQSGGYTGEVTGSNTATLTTTWQRFSYSYTVGATATEAAVGFAYTPVGTAGTNDYFEVTGVQLESSSVATPFNRMAETIQGELAACQRYYEVINQTQTNTAPLGIGVYNSTTELFLTIWFKVNKRITSSPTLTVIGGVTNYIVGTGRNSTAVVADQISAEAASIKVTTSVATAGSAAICFLNNSVNSSLAFSAEL